MFVNQVQTNHHGSPNGPIISHVFVNQVGYRPIIMVVLTSPIISHVFVNQVQTNHHGSPNGPIISHVFVNQVQTNHHGSPNGPIISHVFVNQVGYRPIIMVVLTVL